MDRKPATNGDAEVQRIIAREYPSVAHILHEDEPCPIPDTGLLRTLGTLSASRQSWVK
jgi:hypothetical protein